MSLTAMGAPADEYDPEVSTILPRLREARAAVDVQRIVHEEFVRWFGANLVGPLTDYAEVAAYTDIFLCSIWAIHRIRQTPINQRESPEALLYDFQRIKCGCVLML
jgi:hypothetical protein